MALPQVRDGVGWGGVGGRLGFWATRLYIMHFPLSFNRFFPSLTLSQPQPQPQPQNPTPTPTLRYWSFHHSGGHTIYVFGDEGDRIYGFRQVPYTIWAGMYAAEALVMLCVLLYGPAVQPQT